MPLFRVCYPLCNIWRKSFQNLICVMLPSGTFFSGFLVFFGLFFLFLALTSLYAVEDGRTLRLLCFLSFLFYGFYK